MASSTSKAKLLQSSVPLLAPTQPSVKSKVLPVDVLLAILKQAHGTVPLPSLRVVSRLFDDLIVPIIYQHITLNPRLVACFLQGTSGRPPAQVQVFRDIRTHTRHVSIGEELKWPLVAHLLYSLENFRELTYAMMLCTRFQRLISSLKLARC